MAHGSRYNGERMNDFRLRRFAVCRVPCVGCRSQTGSALEKRLVAAKGLHWDSKV